MTQEEKYQTEQREIEDLVENLIEEVAEVLSGGGEVNDEDLNEAKAQILLILKETK